MKTLAETSGFFVGINRNGAKTLWIRRSIRIQSFVNTKSELEFFA